MPMIRCTILTLALLALAVPALADDAKTEPQAAGYDEAMMAAWQKAMTPGEQHEFLSGMTGDWTFTSTVWMDPNQPPMKSSGKSEKKMIMGGRYLEENATGEMMGHQFTGRATTGYNNTTGEFIGTWIDTMETGIMVTHGERDGNALTMHGEYTDPMSKQAMKVRMVTRVVDQDHHVFEYYMTMPEAPEFKSMQIEYVRESK